MPGWHLHLNWNRNMPNFVGVINAVIFYSAVILRISVLFVFHVHLSMNPPSSCSSATIMVLHLLILLSFILHSLFQDLCVHTILLLLLLLPCCPIVVCMMNAPYAASQNLGIVLTYTGEGENCHQVVQYLDDALLS